MLGPSLKGPCILYTLQESAWIVELLLKFLRIITYSFSLSAVTFVSVYADAGLRFNPIYGPLLDRFSSWYIAERNPRYLKRNALVSIGNSKETENELFKALLTEYLLNSDPLLRSHAVWASIRLGHKELVDLVKNDSDPLVVNEIMLAKAEGHL